MLYQSFLPHYTVQLFPEGILPFSFELNKTLNSTALYWNLTWEVYYIQELSSSDELIEASSINNTSLFPYFINSNTTTLKISICPEGYEEITIGKITCYVF